MTEISIWQRITEKKKKIRELQENAFKTKVNVKQRHYYSFRMEPLPESEWKTCDKCDGTGTRYTSGDAHKSDGLVPCKHCSKGTVMSKEVRTKHVLY